MLFSHIIQRVFNIWPRRSNQIYVKDDAIDKKATVQKKREHTRDAKYKVSTRKMLKFPDAFFGEVF